MIKKIGIIAMVLTLCIGVLSGCSENNDVSSNIDDGSSIVDDNSNLDASENAELNTDENVFTVNNVNISNSLYKYVFNNLKYEKDYGDETYWIDNTEGLDNLKNETEEMITQYYAITKIIAEEYDITLSDEELQQLNEGIASEIENAGGEESFEKQIEASYLDMETYNDYMLTMSLNMILYDSLYAEDGKLTESDDTIKEYYTDYIVAKHILVLKDNIESDTDENTEDELTGLELAEVVLEKAKDGEDFDSLIDEYGQDPGMVEQPDGYFFTYGDMVTEFEEAAYALEIDEISDIVETDYGYHIIKKIPIEDYYEKHFEAIKYSYYNKKYNELLENTLNSLQITYGENYDSITINSFK